MLLYGRFSPVNNVNPTSIVGIGKCASLAMPEPAELVAAADTLAEASLYKEAISTYSKAIELNPTAPVYYLKRYFSFFTQGTNQSSTAYQRSNSLIEALKVLPLTDLNSETGC